MNQICRAQLTPDVERSLRSWRGERHNLLNQADWSNGDWRAYWACKETFGRYYHHTSTCREIASGLRLQVESLWYRDSNHDYLARDVIIFALLDGMFDLRGKGYDIRVGAKRGLPIQPWDRLNVPMHVMPFNCTEPDWLREHAPSHRFPYERCPDAIGFDNVEEATHYKLRWL